MIQPLTAIRATALSALLALGAAPALAQEPADEYLRGQVDMALTLSRDLQNTEITTELRDDGTLVLSGEVGTDTQVGLANDIAGSIAGEDRITSELETNRALAQRGRQNLQSMQKEAYVLWHEAHVEAELLAAYADSPAMEDYEIEFELDGDVLNLTGRVGTDIEKTIATQQAMQLDEVAQVNNRLEVSNRPEPVTAE